MLKGSYRSHSAVFPGDSGNLALMDPSCLSLQLFMHGLSKAMQQHIIFLPAHAPNICKQIDNQ